MNKSRAFSHGQPYVSTSRVKDGANIRFLLPHGQVFLYNVVQQRLIDREEIDNAAKLWAEQKDEFYRAYSTRQPAPVVSQVKKLGMD